MKDILCGCCLLCPYFLSQWGGGQVVGQVIAQDGSVTQFAIKLSEGWDGAGSIWVKLAPWSPRRLTPTGQSGVRQAGNPAFLYGKGIARLSHPYYKP